jgi:hypothetical protein
VLILNAPIVVIVIMIILGYAVRLVGINDRSLSSRPVIVNATVFLLAIGPLGFAMSVLVAGLGEMLGSMDKREKDRMWLIVVLSFGVLLGLYAVSR